MRNIRLTVEYDGGRYGGWQRLGKEESENTIENKLLEIIKKMTGVDGEINCGCRTEVGVHAYSQVVNFKTASELKLTEIKRYFNRYLPMDIAVIEIEEMPERFHASLNAKSKTYLYRIAIGEVPSVFDRKFTYYCFQTPDVKTMRSAARHFVGKHDFKKFSSVKKGKSTEKEIFSIDIREEDREIKIIIKADDFLHNMARIIIGTMLEIGLGKRKVEDIDAIFQPGSKEIASVACSAQGLFLKEIEY
mgnify:FL=1